MKKTLFILITMLVAVYGALSALGSGGEYAGERILYRAMKVNAEIAANPDVVPPKLVEYVETNLKSVVERYPKTDVARVAHITLAEFYIHHKKYRDALSKIDVILKTYENIPSVVSTAHFLKGKVYERQDAWPKALAEYAIVRDEYTYTALGMQMPLYVAQYYAVKGRDADARQAFNEAALFYERLERGNSKKILGYIASTMLIQAYMSAKNYEEAGKALEKTIDTYRGGRTLTQLLPQVENIFVSKLKRPGKAIEIYESVKEMVKDERLSAFLDKRIATIRL